ncbi:OPT oligopeptide transporter protein-domain-containing protein [Blastocladiella britannica]|nr:OPT oligopeptide transporter protein-domain-containing protein [Blastocladiella britannica]
MDAYYQHQQEQRQRQQSANRPPEPPRRRSSTVFGTAATLAASRGSLPRLQQQQQQQPMSPTSPLGGFGSPTSPFGSLSRNRPSSPVTPLGFGASRFHATLPAPILATSLASGHNSNYQSLTSPAASTPSPITPGSGNGSRPLLPTSPGSTNAAKSALLARHSHLMASSAAASQPPPPGSPMFSVIGNVGGGDDDELGQQPHGSLDAIDEHAYTSVLREAMAAATSEAARMYPVPPPPSQQQQRDIETSIAHRALSPPPESEYFDESSIALPSSYGSGGSASAAAAYYPYRRQQQLQRQPQQQQQQQQQQLSQQDVREFGSSLDKVPVHVWSPERAGIRAPDATERSSPIAIKNELATGVQGFIVDKDFESAIQDIVPRHDHPETPAFTFRVVVIGTLFCVLMAAINQLFYYFNGAFSVSIYVPTVLAFPLGNLMERIVPSYHFTVPGTRWVFDTNPGPFSVKELTLIGIFASTGGYGVYGISNLVVTEQYFQIKINPGWAILFLLSSSMIGFGLAGMLRSVLVRPIEFVWPTILPTVSLYSALFGWGVDANSIGVNSSIDAGTLEKPAPYAPLPRAKPWSRMRMFTVAAVGIAVWQLFPTFIAPGIANIGLGCVAERTFTKSTLTWQTLGSFSSGVGIGSVTTDWSNVGSWAMTIPWWTTASMFAGTVFFVWIITPIAWSQGWFYDESTSQEVLNSINLMNTDGTSVDTSTWGDQNTWMDLLNGANAPIRISPAFAISYFTSFAQFPAAIVHTVVWYGGDIWRRVRGVNKNKMDLDIHCLLIDQYPEVPTWVYALLFTGSAVGLMVANALSGMSDFSSVAETSGLQTSALLAFAVVPLAILVGSIAAVPSSLMFATTGIDIGLNVFSEVVWGYIDPGNPLSLMAFKSIALLVATQCTMLLSDLKLGHYIKVPPRAIFAAQFISQIITVIVCYATNELWYSNPVNQKALKFPGATLSQWTDPGDRTFFTASLIYGGIGPARFFGPTSPYGSLLWLGGLIGALTPVVFKALDVVFANGPIPWKYIQAPILFSVTSTGSNQTYITSLAVAAISQVYFYRYHLPLWKRYNYIIAAALDAGTALTGTVINGILMNAFPDAKFPTWLLNPDLGDSSSTALAWFGAAGDFCVVPSATT